MASTTVSHVEYVLDPLRHDLVLKCGVS